MTSFGAQIDLGCIPSEGKKVQFLGIAEDEDDESILVTPSQYYAFSMHVQSKNRARTFTIPKDLGPLDGPLQWLNKTSRYVALARSGSVLLHWTSGKSSDPSSFDARLNRPAGKMKVIELSPPAWRILRCGDVPDKGRRRCADNLWLVYPNGYAESVAVLVEKSLGKENKDKKSPCALQKTVEKRGLFTSVTTDEKDGFDIADAAVFCERQKESTAVHRIAILIGTKLRNSEHLDPYSIELIESPLGKSKRPERRRVLLDRPSSPAVVANANAVANAGPVVATQGRTGDEEGSDEGFIDSMEVRMTDEDSNPSDVVVSNAATSSSSAKRPGLLLSSSFCTRSDNPGLLTLWEDKSVRSLSLTEVLPEVPPEELRDETMMETGLYRQFSLTNYKMTADWKGRPSLFVLDADRFLLHSFGLEEDTGSLAIWNFRHQGILEDYTTMKMFDPLSWSCRVGGFAVAKNCVAFTVGRSAFATEIHMAPRSQLSDVVGFAVVPAFRGNFAGVTFLNVPCAFGSGDSVDGYSRIVDAQWEEPMPLHHLPVPEECGDKVVAMYIREGRVQELIHVLSNENQFLRESLVISALKFALDLKSDSKQSEPDEEESVQKVKSELLQAVLRQPLAKSYLRTCLTELTEEKAFELLMQLVKLMDESCPVWKPDGKGPVTGGVSTVLEWLGAVVEGKFSSLTVNKLQNSKETAVLLQNKFNNLAESWSGTLKELRTWDGAMSEVNRRVGESRTRTEEKGVEKAKKSGLIGVTRIELAQRAQRAPKNYRLRVIANLW